MANPRRADEIMMTAAAARLLGLHLGSVMPLGFYTSAQSNLPGFGTARVQPYRRVDAKLVGIVVPGDAVIQMTATAFRRT